MVDKYPIIVGGVPPMVGYLFLEALIMSEWLRRRRHQNIL